MNKISIIFLISLEKNTLAKLLPVADARKPSLIISLKKVSSKSYAMIYHTDWDQIDGQKANIQKRWPKQS